MMESCFLDTIKQKIPGNHSGDHFVLFALFVTYYCF